MNGWSTVSLGEVAAIERASVPPEAIETGTKYVGLEHIEDTGLFVGVKAVDSGVLASSKFQFTEKHILYGKLRPYLAKIACPDFGGICSTDILPILPGPKADRRYLFHFLRQPRVIDYAASQAVGINLPRLSPSVLETFQVPLPPLVEQRRIAAILDKADELRSKRRATKQLLNDLAESTFLSLFGDPAHNTKGLRIVNLGSLGEWRSGGTPPRDREDYFKGSVPWLSSGELNEMIVTETQEQISELALKETSAKEVAKGSLMLGMYDTAALKASIAGVRCSCNQAIAFAEIDRSLAEPIFVYFAIVIGREHFRRLQRGVRQKNLNLSMIKELQIPLPELKLQLEFVRCVNVIERVKAAHDASSEELDALFASLQHRAFRAEL